MPKRRRPTRPIAEDTVGEALRIIGGEFRGRKLQYEPLSEQGAKVTRPMKHRVREAIFNLVGLRAKGKHALDLFAGTGALGLEALSRGSLRATLIERHIPTAQVVRENVKTLGVESRCEVLTTSAFLWLRRDLPQFDPSAPWLVFISPPYDFFVQQEDAMVGMITEFTQRAPNQSLLVVEADERFDFAKLPGNVKEDRYADGWDVRAYKPAVVGVWEVGE